jgi:hypothetical protein
VAGGQRAGKSESHRARVPESQVAVPTPEPGHGLDCCEVRSGSLWPCVPGYVLSLALSGSRFPSGSKPRARSGSGWLRLVTDCGSLGPERNQEPLPESGPPEGAKAPDTAHGLHRDVPPCWLGPGGRKAREPASQRARGATGRGNQPRRQRRETRGAIPVLKSCQARRACGSVTVTLTG